MNKPEEVVTPIDLDSDDDGVDVIVTLLERLEEVLSNQEELKESLAEVIEKLDNLSLPGGSFGVTEYES